MNSNKFILFLFCALLAAIPLRGQINQSDMETPIREYLERLEKLGFAGTVVVYHKGELLLADGFGLAHRSKNIAWAPFTVSTMGHVSRIFTAAAILKLKEQGKLSVDDSITKYFDNVPQDKAGITLHHLLSNSAGLTDFPSDLEDQDQINYTKAKLLDYAFSQPLQNNVGEWTGWSDVSFALLAAVIEQVSGVQYEQYLHNTIFNPLSMKQTGTAIPEWDMLNVAVGYDDFGNPIGTDIERPFIKNGPTWRYRGAHAIQTTGIDMYKFGKALLDGKILSEKSLADMFSHQTVESEPQNNFFGYGWQVRYSPNTDTKFAWHQGGIGEIFASFRIITESNSFIFLQGNAISEFVVTDFTLQNIFDFMFDGQDLPEVPDIYPLSDIKLETFKGTYKLENGNKVKIASQRGALTIETPGVDTYLDLFIQSSAEHSRLKELTGKTQALIDALKTEDFATVKELYANDIPEKVLRNTYEDWLETPDKLEIIGASVPATGIPVVYVKTGHTGFSPVRRTGWNNEGKLLGQAFHWWNTHPVIYQSAKNTFVSWGYRIPSGAYFTFKETGEGMIMNIGFGENPSRAIQISE